MKIFYFKEDNSVLTKKKKIFIIFGMVALLVVTGCLNLFLNKEEIELQQTTSSQMSLLTSYRASKLETRNSMLEIYDSIIATSTDKEQIIETNALISDLAGRMEQETVLEGMIMASGYEDVVVTNSDDNYTVMVKSNGLTSDDVAKILGILVKETGVSATNVKISSV
ncbi:MAG: SpoIIIAH-like family protein [Clostridiales bacterium]|nr:SpoIIIAH-like family protein [Clostridiales bacterium]